MTDQEGPALGPVDHPRLVIMRGVPGAGISTEARRIHAAAQARGLSACIRSTDDYFLVPDGQGGTVRAFDPGKLQEYHAANRDATWRAMDADTDVVIVDNTNTTDWEVAEYLKLAWDGVYQVELREPTSPWWRAARPRLGMWMRQDQWLELAAPFHAHSDPVIPLKTMARMLRRWQNMAQFDADTRGLLESLIVPTQAQASSTPRPGFSGP